MKHSFKNWRYSYFYYTELQGDISGVLENKKEHHLKRGSESELKAQFIKLGIINFVH